MTFGLSRFLLALTVCVCHATGFDEPPIARWAVYAFFILSGYIMSAAIDTFYLGRPGAFFANRLLCILPTYYVCLAVSWLLWTLAHIPQDGPPNLWPNLFGWIGLRDYWGAFGWVPGHLYLNYLWAITEELKFYTLLAGTMWLGTQTRSRLLWLLFLAGLILWCPHHWGYFAAGMLVWQVCGEVTMRESDVQRGLGLFSYPLYLCHFAVIQLHASQWPRAGPGAVVMLSVALAVLIAYVVELTTYTVRTRLRRASV